MLKKSTANPNPPMVAEGKSHGAGAPKTVPNKPASTKNRVLLTEAKGGGRTGSTFKAPRNDSGGHSAYDCGYTKPGKM